MIGAHIIPALKRFRRAESGASMIEYTVVLSVFLLLYFAILDFGRLGFNWVMTEKAMQRAARIATVRPPVCPGVPDTVTLNTGSGLNFGALCRAGACQPVNGGAPQQCVLGTAAFDCTNVTTTAGEIWCTLEPILPSNAVPQNIWVSYTYDANLGFAGGPYVPMVEVGVATDVEVATITNAQELRFEFVTPIPGLSAISGGATQNTIDSTTALPSIPYPDISVSLPAEDLNNGDAG